MKLTAKIAPCLWFNNQAEAAANFYTSIFPDSRIVRVNRYTEAGREMHGQPAGAVMTVAFEIAGQPFTALNGGPVFTINEAISFQVQCDTQEEVDHYWSKLTEGGEEVQCGWLKDQFGVSWQINPREMETLFSGDNPEKSARAMQAMFGMKKLDIAALKRAYEGT